MAPAPAGRRAGLRRTPRSAMRRGRYAALAMARSGRCMGGGCRRPGMIAPIQGQGPTGVPLAEGCTDPSGFRSRGPASACRPRAKAASSSRLASTSSVSGLSTTTHEPLAFSTPRLQAAPKPILRSRGVKRTWPRYSRAAGSGSSPERLSTTTSSGADPRWRFMVATSASSIEADCHVTTTTE